MEFDIEDMRQFADRHRGKNVTSGPHWPTIIRFPILFDEYERLLRANIEQQYELNSERQKINDKEKIKREMIQNMTQEALQHGAELYDLLVQATKDDQRYRSMTNAELAKELMVLWGEIPMFAKFSNLLDEVMMRLGGVREEGE